jgi:hypothetical protein
MSADMDVGVDHSRHDREAREIVGHALGGTIAELGNPWALDGDDGIALDPAFAVEDSGGPDGDGLLRDGRRRQTKIWPGK